MGRERDQDLGCDRAKSDRQRCRQKHGRIDRSRRHDQRYGGKCESDSDQAAIFNQIAKRNDEQ